jgi:MtN3 and saliva related transmembrane protein
MLSADLIGSLAATLTTVAFIPQVLQVYRTRHTHDISLGMYISFIAGVALWLAYGLLLGSWPIIIANGITLGLAGAVLIMKIRFG